MNILFINSCVREQDSRTLTLCKTFLNALHLEKEDQIKELDLSKESLISLTKETLDKRSQLIAKELLDEPIFAYAKEIAQADYIVIGAPYWDMSFPAILKQYIEQICVDKITFQYVDNQSIGLCRAKKQMYISTAGGYIEGIHLGEETLKQVGDMIGLKNWDTYCLEGLDIYGVDVEKQMEFAKDEVEFIAKHWMNEEKLSN